LRQRRHGIWKARHAGRVGRPAGAWLAARPRTLQPAPAGGGGGRPARGRRGVLWACGINSARRDRQGPQRGRPDPAPSALLCRTHPFARPRRLRAGPARAPLRRPQPSQIVVLVILVPFLAVSVGLVLLSVALMRYLRYLKRSHDAIHLTVRGRQGATRRQCVRSRIGVTMCAHVFGLCVRIKLSRTGDTILARGRMLARLCARGHVRVWVCVRVCVCK
jgi:hypothetical protein